MTASPVHSSSADPLTLSSRARAIPLPDDPDRARNGWIDFNEAVSEAGLDELKAATLTPENREKMDAIFGNSPYLTRIMVRKPELALNMLDDAGDLCRTIMDELAAHVPTLTDTDAVMAALRRAKLKVSLVVAAADIWSLWPLDRVTGTLSTLAELTLDLAVAHLLRAGMVKGELAPPDGCTDPAALTATPELGRKSGFIVLGMGKLGGRELNYSSDIDLILLFDNDVVRYTGRKTVQQFFVRLARDLVRMMQERTGDGYVFRTDLRLRPDPGASNIAM
ncbi:MAG: hypothetical protein WEB93_00455, partial [Sphingomonadales bacterium]